MRPSARILLAFATSLAAGPAAGAGAARNLRDVPVGSKLRLAQALELPPGADQILFQGGKVVSRLQSGPSCWLNLAGQTSEPKVLEAGRELTVEAALDSVVPSHGITSTMLRLDDAELQSLVCCGAFDASYPPQCPPGQRPATIAVFERAVGTLVTLERPSEILGAWRSACFALKGDGAGLTRQYAWEFRADGRFASTVEIFLGPDCELRRMVRRDRAEGTFEVVGPGKLDVHETRKSFSLWHREVLEDARSDRLCGIDDWSYGSDRDVTGKTCNGEEIVPEPWYTSFVVGGDRLRFALSDASGDGTARDRRATKIDAKREFRRQ